MAERKNPTKRTEQRVRIDAVLRGITSGNYDEELSQIQAALNERQAERKEAIMEMVHEVFGPEATVSIPRHGVVRSPAFAEPEAEETPKEPEESVNPASIQQGPAKIGPDMPMPTTRPAGADRVSAKERQMEDEIENRGAIIGGLPE